MNVRTVVKALVIDNGKILVNRNVSTLGDTWPGFPNGMVHYDLPGGGQEKYETLADALRRECLEETGYSVTVGRLAAVFEEIADNELIRLHHERHARFTVNGWTGGIRQGTARNGGTRKPRCWREYLKRSGRLRRRLRKCCVNGNLRLPCPLS